MGRTLQDPFQRFCRKVEKTNSCWYWRGGMHVNGYGLFYLKTKNGWKTVWAHRQSYEFHLRKLQPGETIDHLCRVTNCVNPAHMEAVSIGENSRRSPYTLTGANIRKTNCPRGHDYKAHGYLDNGKRKCRICVNARNRKAHARRREERAAKARAPIHIP